jgi:hypothetical protein
MYGLSALVDDCVNLTVSSSIEAIFVDTNSIDGLVVLNSGVEGDYLPPEAAYQVDPKNQVKDNPHQRTVCFVGDADVGGGDHMVKL